MYYQYTSGAAWSDKGAIAFSSNKRDGEHFDVYVIEAGDATVMLAHDAVLAHAFFTYFLISRRQLLVRRGSVRRVWYGSPMSLGIAYAKDSLETGGGVRVGGRYMNSGEV